MTDEEKKAKEAEEKKKAEDEKARKAELDAAVEKAVAKAIEKTKKDLLAEIGVDDPAAAKAAVEAAKKAEDARLSEAEKAQKAIKEALDGRAAAEAKLKELEASSKASVDAATERARRAEFFADAGVRPGDRVVVGALLDAAKAADAKLDEKAWAEGLKKERPYLFGAAAQPADTSTAPPGQGAGAGAGATPGAGGFVPSTAGAPMLAPPGAPAGPLFGFGQAAGGFGAFVPAAGGHPAFAPPPGQQAGQGGRPFNALEATPQQVAEMRRQINGKRPLGARRLHPPPPASDRRHGRADPQRHPSGDCCPHPDEHSRLRLPHVAAAEVLLHGGRRAEDAPAPPGRNDDV